MRPRFLELNEMQRSFIKEFICKSNRRALAKALEVDHRLVRSYVSFLEKSSLIPSKRKKGQYNEQVLKEIIKSGSESPMLRKLFVKREGMPWSPQEDSLLEDSSGERSNFEIAVLLGRTEMAVAKRMVRLGISAVENSGLWTVEDVASVTGLTIKQVRRRVEKGIIKKVSGSGKSTRSLTLNVSKLRFFLKPGVKNKTCGVDKVFLNFKKGMFSRVLFNEEDIDKFVSKNMVDCILSCIFCSNKAKGSIYCFNCKIEPEKEPTPPPFLDILARVSSRNQLKV